MAETDIIEIDIDNVQVEINSPSDTEGNPHLKNPFAQFKLNPLNKRSRNQSHNDSDNEQNTKKIRQEENIVQTVVGSNNLFDDEIIEIEEVRMESTGAVGETNQTELSKTQNYYNSQNKDDQRTKRISNNNDIALDNCNQPAEANFLYENNQVEVSNNIGECEVLWTETCDDSVENYIKEEVEKRVKEKVETFENMAKTKIMQHELEWINKFKKMEAEFALELEKQKNENNITDIKDGIQEERKDELVQAILLEKQLEEQEATLKSRIEKLKLLTSKFIQQMFDLKLIRKQNRELFKMKIKEWEDEEKFNQNDQQEVSIKREVLTENELNDCACIDDEKPSKSESNTEKIQYGFKFNEPQTFMNTYLFNGRVEREKCRPPPMSPAEWEYEKIERNRRKRNLRIRGLNKAPWMGPRDLEAFFRRETGTIVEVECVIKSGTDIVVQLKTMIDKITILKRVKPNDRGISITNDLSLREEAVQKWLRDEADWLRLKDYSVKTTYMKLMINGFNWVWNDVLGDLIPETIQQKIY